MNVFNIIGPIMIGPSSSHTAGAVRLGRVVNKLAEGKEFKQVDIELSGSFARTYRGHGTDRALLAGIMGYHSYNEEIRDALQIAKDRGIDYRFIENDIPGAHPNTAKGGTALMTIEVDQLPPKELLQDINKLPNVQNAILIRAI